MPLPFLFTAIYVFNLMVNAKPVIKKCMHQTLSFITLYPKSHCLYSFREVKISCVGIGAVFTILLLGAGSVGGYYYFKIWKPKREEEEAKSEDLEFYDGGVYVNEDQENGQGEEEGGESVCREKIHILILLLGGALSFQRNYGIIFP